MASTFIDRFASVLTSDAAPIARDERLLLDRAGDISVYFAPFEHINPAAKVCLVGITPGPTQMVNANLAARAALLSGGDRQAAIVAGKATGAFSGEPLRGNLIRQLNHWGVPDWLGLRDASELFGSARQLLQTTSLIRFPTWVGDKPYAGTPDMTRHPLLRRHLMDFFVSEVTDLPDAVFVALGPTVQRALEVLVAEGHVPRHRVALGMLHPSGNCTYRINYLVGDRDGPVPHATSAAPYDRGRQSFRATYLGVS